MKKKKKKKLAKCNTVGNKLRNRFRNFGLQAANARGGGALENITGPKGWGATTIGCTSHKSYFKVLIWLFKYFAGGPLKYYKM